jgi:hypothetical protein
MKAISAGLCAAVALVTTAAARPSGNEPFMKPAPPRAKRMPAQPTTLKGYALGTTLDAFKQMPAPPNAAGAVRVICSDDPATQASLGPALTPRFQGEVVCGFQLLSSRDWGPGLLMLDATRGAAVAFHFFNGSLVQIESEEDAELSDVIAQSLTTRFGQPATINNRVSRSISDVVRTQIVVTWINGRDVIVMTSPSLGTDRMSVVYTNVKGVAAMQSSGTNIM